MTTIRAYSRLSVAREASQQLDRARHLIERWAELTHPCGSFCTVNKRNCGRDQCGCNRK